MAVKILNTIGDIYTQEAKDILMSCGDVTFATYTQQELEENIGEYDIALVGLGLHFNAQVLTKATRLKALATATTGLDHIDLAAAEQKGIAVLSLKNEIQFLESITSTAELALGLLLDLSRFISVSFASVQRHEWKRELFRGHSLQNKILGIVGLGRLGCMMARFAKAVGMEVIAFDPYISQSIFEKNGVRSVSFEELIQKSDAVSLHVHLSQETENMFCKSVFEKMKPSAYLINTSRGKIVNESDIVHALEETLIAGYATDVLDGELEFSENFSSHPLVEYAQTHSNVIITPHIGGMTHESREATDVFMAQKVKKYIHEL